MFVDVLSQFVPNRTIQPECRDREVTSSSSHPHLVRYTLARPPGDQRCREEEPGRLCGRDGRKSQVESVAPIVVGVDEGEDSREALRWAAEFARPVGAPLIAVAAFETPTTYGAHAMADWEDPRELENRARNVFPDTVSETLSDDAKVELSVIQAHPAQALLEASRDAQLVVVGCRAHGGFAGMRLGPVSQHVVPHVVGMSHRDAPKA